MAERIPDEIMEAAAEICSQIAEFGKPAQETIARALYAERKRAAEICEHYAHQWDMGGLNGKPNDGFNACMEASCAILASKVGGE